MTDSRFPLIVHLWSPVPGMLDFWHQGQETGEPVVYLRQGSSRDPLSVPAHRRLSDSATADAFWSWLPRAYTDGDKGDAARFTKWNMEVAFSAGAAWAKEPEPSDDLIERVAVALWRDDARRAGAPDSTISARTSTAFKSAASWVRDPWRRQARVAIAASRRLPEVAL